MNQPYDGNAVPRRASSPPPPPQWSEQHQSQQHCPGCGSWSPPTSPFCVRCRRVLGGHAAASQPVQVQMVPPQLRDPTVPSSSRRLLASLIDQGIAAALWLMPLYLVLGRDDDGLLPVVTLAVGVVYFIGSIVVQGITGRTFGKWILGLRTVSIVPGAGGELPAPGIARSLWRTVVLGLANVLLYFGAWSVLIESGRRGVADKMASTRVVNARGVDNPLTTVRAEEAHDLAPRGFSRLQLTPEEQVMMPTPAPTQPTETGSGGFHLAPTDPVPVNSVPGVIRDGTPVPAVPSYQARKADPIRVVTRSVPVAAATVEVPVGEPERVEETSMVPAPVDQTRMTSVVADVIRLIFDDGTTFDVIGDGLVGRDPSRAGGEPVEHAVSLADSTMSLSKTHLGFGLAKGVLWVEDRHSTNGSAWEYQGRRESLVPGTRVDVPAGATVHMGARFFQVAR